PLRGFFLQRLHADVLQISRDRGVDAARQNGITLADSADLLLERVCAKRHDARQKLIEEGSQREDVAARSQFGFRARLLGGEVVRRAEDLTRAREPAAEIVHLLGEAEVEQLRLEIRAHKDVSGFEVAMNQMMLVQE